MRSMLRTTLVAALPLTVCALSLAAFGCDSGTPRRGPCGGSMPLAGCDQACSPAAPCPSGLYCSSSDTCLADCLQGSTTCGAARECSPDGRCVARGVDAAVVGADAPFVAVDANFGDVGMADNTCASVMLDATRVIPNVLLIVDRSGSMQSNEFSPGVTRWDALESALLAPGGLVPSLESSVRFGIAMYSNDTRTATCPDLFTVPCQLVNAEAIAAEYTLRTPPRGDTPTGQSIAAVLGMIDTLVPDRGPTSPTVFVLATDGEPDTCEDGTDLTRGRELSVESVTGAQTAGIDTFVVSVGSEVSTPHLQDLANAGIGGVGAPFWVATDTAGLVDALSTIIRGVASCDVRLEGMVEPTLACDGTVRLGATPLACGTDWMLLDDGRTIRLLGTACERLQTSGETLTASFPCEAVLG